jgi:hypothetical protein
MCISGESEFDEGYIYANMYLYTYINNMDIIQVHY